MPEGGTIFLGILRLVVDLIELQRDIDGLHFWRPGFSFFLERLTFLVLELVARLHWPFATSADPFLDPGFHDRLISSLSSPAVSTFRVLGAGDFDLRFLEMAGDLAAGLAIGFGQPLVAEVLLILSVAPS